jgi:hypothetical protein
MRDTGADRGLVSAGKRGSLMKIIGAEDNLRTYTFYFQMPELTSVNMGQSATAKASDYGTAFNRAWKEVKKRKGVKGHSITQMKVSIVVAEKPKNNTNG